MKLNLVEMEPGVSVWQHPDDGGILSSEDAFEYIPCSPWGMMIPPRTPKKYCLLGTGKNTMGRIVERLFPGVEITLVDIDPCEGVPGVIQSDGLEYLKSCPDDAFDCIGVDLWGQNLGGKFNSYALPQYMYVNAMKGNVAHVDEFYRELARVGTYANINYPRMFERRTHPRDEYFRLMHSGHWAGNVVDIVKRIRR